MIMAGYGRLFNSRSCFGICSNRSTLRPNLTDYQRCLTTKVQSVEELNLPVAPKRPLSPYFRFLVHIRPKVVEQNPGLKGPEIIKKVAQEWAKLDPKEKKIFNDEYNDELTIYTNKQMEYEKSITDEQKKLIKSTKEKKKRDSKKIELRHKTHDLGKPKRSVNAFMLFMSARRDTRDVSIKYQDWLHLLGEEWNSFPVEKKQEFVQVSAELREKYKKDVKQWEEKMIRLGNIDVVRNKALIDGTMKKNNPE